MGRGVAWTPEECSNLARAWINASEDPRTGTDQTSHVFFNKMFKTFAEKAPPGANEKQYGARKLKACRSKWEQIAADVQKFRSALRHISACKPTGVNAENMLSMAIAKHLGKRKSMSYDAKDFPHHRWLHHLAFKVLRNHPKFQDIRTEADSSSTKQHDSMPSTVELPTRLTPAKETVDDSNTASHALSPPPSGEPSFASPATIPGVATPVPTPPLTMADNDVLTPSLSDSGAVVLYDDSDDGDGSITKRRKARGGYVGRKRAKSEAFDQKLKVQCARNTLQIAQSMSERTELMRERNALLAFAKEDCETEEDKKDRAEFLRILRKQHLQHMRKQSGAVAPANVSANYNEELTGAGESSDALNVAAELGDIEE